MAFPALYSKKLQVKMCESTLSSGATPVLLGWAPHASSSLHLLLILFQQQVLCSCFWCIEGFRFKITGLSKINLYINYIYSYSKNCLQSSARPPSGLSVFPSLEHLHFCFCFFPSRLVQPKSNITKPISCYFESKQLWLELKG